jgi:DNA ligase D-like protein (predicted polymerase)
VSRPVALLRAPNGVDKQLFFQKHADTHKLIGIKQLNFALNSNRPPMLEIVNKQGLFSATQCNVIEFHTLNGVATRFAHSDGTVFDLDPGDDVLWNLIQKAAELMRTFLTQLGLVPYLKTSVGKGRHAVVPLRKLHSWNTTQAFRAPSCRTWPKQFHSVSWKNGTLKIAWRAARHRLQLTRSHVCKQVKVDATRCTRAARGPEQLVATDAALTNTSYTDLSRCPIPSPNSLS